VKFSELAEKWDGIYKDTLSKQRDLWAEQHEKLWQKLLGVVNERMEELRDTQAKALTAQTRQLGVQHSEQIVLEIAQRSDSLRKQLLSDFDGYAERWQLALEKQFAKLSEKYSRYHQQEIELLGQETRKDLVRDSELHREALQERFSKALDQATQELKLAYAAELKDQEVRMAHIHQEQLSAIHQEWQQSTNEALANALKSLAADTKRGLDELRRIQTEEYRQQLTQIAEQDLNSRRKAQLELAEQAAKTLRERMEATLKELESFHHEQMQELRKQVNAQHQQDIEKSFKTWQKQASQQIEEQTKNLIESFTERAATVSKEIEEKCYLEYRARLGKMVDELLRRSKETETKVEAERPNSPPPAQTQTQTRKSRR